MKKKILIVGAGDFQLPLVEEAAKDCEVVLVAPAIDGKFDKYVSKKYFCDVREKEKILEIAKREQIDGIVTDQTDIPVRTVAYVAENMGLAGIGYEVSKIFTDKNRMREKLCELGLPCLPYELVSTADEAKAAMEKISGSVILKPLDTQGSRGVTEVSDPRHVKAAFDEAVKYSATGKVLVEKCAHGIEFVVEAATADGICENMICGDTIYFDDKSTFSAKKRTFPSQRDQALVSRVCELNKKIVEGFGLPWGITHGEYIMDGENIYLIEIAARGGGVYISSDLIYERTGFHTERFLIRAALGEKVRVEKHENNIFAGYRAFFLPEGRIQKVRGLSEVRQLPYLRRNQLDHLQVGMQNGKNTNKTSRIAMVLVAENAAEWEMRVENIKQMLHVESKTENGIRDIIWE